jgi:hypothetical protein
MFSFTYKKRTLTEPASRYRKKMGSAAEQRQLESGVSQQTPRLQSLLLGFGCLRI